MLYLIMVEKCGHVDSLFKVVVVASVSVDFFFQNVLGIIYFRNADDVSVVMTVSATMFKPTIFVRRESETYRLVTVIPLHVVSIST